MKAWRKSYNNYFACCFSYIDNSGSNFCVSLLLRGQDYYRKDKDRGVQRKRRCFQSWHHIRHSAAAERKKLEENDLYVRHLRTALSANAHIKAFKKVLGQSPWTHYVVNGYHFIGASPNNGSMSCGYKLTSKWLARELEKASKDTPDKPIFVMTHN